MVTSQRNIDSVDLDGKSPTNEKSIKEEEEENAKSCCCYDVKKVFQRHSHANEGKQEVTESNNERDT